VKLFDHFPAKAKCPVCKTNDDKPCFLMPIYGTERDGNCEAAPTHADCIRERIDQFRYHRELGVIYMMVTMTQEG